MPAELSLGAGSPIELKHENGCLIIEPVRPVRQGWFDTPPAKDSRVLDTLPVEKASKTGNGKAR